jgi:ferrous iron transport protein A
MINQKNLSVLKPGEKGIVIGFTDSVLALKFLEMGLLPGSEIVLSHIAPFGDPIAIKLSDYLLALRIDEAKTVMII